MVESGIPGQRMCPTLGAQAMPQISTEVVALLQYLAPGFLVTWLYFGLTPHEKPSQFERTVQALIYTAVVQALVALEKLIATRIGEWHSYGEWTEDGSPFSRIIRSSSVLHLKDKSSVHGWPSMWPAASEKGHFLLAYATRTLSDSGQGISQSHALVINVADVVFVEFTAPKEHIHD